MKGYKKGKSKRETDAIGGAMSGKTGEAARGIMRRREHPALKRAREAAESARSPMKGTYSK